MVLKAVSQCTFQLELNTCTFHIGIISNLVTVLICVHKELSYVDKVEYLGVYICVDRSFRCLY
jgi:hypothetical protein